MNKEHIIMKIIAAGTIYFILAVFLFFGFMFCLPGKGSDIDKALELMLFFCIMLTIVSTEIFALFTLYSRIKFFLSLLVSPIIAFVFASITLFFKIMQTMGSLGDSEFVGWGLLFIIWLFAFHPIGYTIVAGLRKKFFKKAFWSWINFLIYFVIIILLSVLSYLFQTFGIKQVLIGILVISLPSIWLIARKYNVNILQTAAHGVKILIQYVSKGTVAAYVGFKIKFIEIKPKLININPYIFIGGMPAISLLWKLLISVASLYTYDSFNVLAYSTLILMPLLELLLFAAGIYSFVKRKYKRVVLFIMLALFLLVISLFLNFISLFILVPI
ncbi:MAG: hypothetical protein LBL00_05485 [Endomicrobium sp.]|jgi:hypothetical protein|nr:hypothetical protein [Endomicrobium sp.]